MSLLTLDAPNRGAQSAPQLRRSPRPEPLNSKAAPRGIPKLTPERWAEIQARLDATGHPPESQDDGPLARMLGIALLGGLTLTSLSVYGLSRLFS